MQATTVNRFSSRKGGGVYEAERVESRETSANARSASATRGMAMATSAAWPTRSGTTDLGARVSGRMHAMRHRARTARRTGDPVNAPASFGTRKASAPFMLRSAHGLHPHEAYQLFGAGTSTAMMYNGIYGTHGSGTDRNVHNGHGNVWDNHTRPAPCWQKFRHMEHDNWQRRNQRIGWWQQRRGNRSAVCWQQMSSVVTDRRRPHPGCSATHGVAGLAGMHGRLRGVRHDVLAATVGLCHAAILRRGAAMAYDGHRRAGRALRRRVRSVSTRRAPARARILGYKP